MHNKRANNSPFMHFSINPLLSRLSARVVMLAVQLYISHDVLQSRSATTSATIGSEGVIVTIHSIDFLSCPRDIISHSMLRIRKWELTASRARAIALTLPYRHPSKVEKRAANTWFTLLGSYSTEHTIFRLVIVRSKQGFSCAKHVECVPYYLVPAFQQFLNILELNCV